MANKSRIASPPQIAARSRADTKRGDNTENSPLFHKLCGRGHPRADNPTRGDLSLNVPFLKLPTKRPPKRHPADFQSEIAISVFKAPGTRAN